MKVVYKNMGKFALWCHEQDAAKLAWALKNGDELLAENPDGTQRRLISDEALQRAVRTVLVEPQHLKEIERLRAAHRGAVAEARRWKQQVYGPKKAR